MNNNEQIDIEYFNNLSTKLNELRAQVLELPRNNEVAKVLGLPRRADNDSNATFNRLRKTQEHLKVITDAPIKDLSFINKNIGPTMEIERDAAESLIEIKNAAVELLNRPKLPTIDETFPSICDITSHLQSIDDFVDRAELFTENVAFILEQKKKLFKPVNLSLGSTSDHSAGEDDTSNSINTNFNDIVASSSQIE